MVRIQKTRARLLTRVFKTNRTVWLLLDTREELILQAGFIDGQLTNADQNRACRDGIACQLLRNLRDHPRCSDDSRTYGCDNQTYLL